MSAHHLLGLSGFDRWSVCSLSARATEGMPDQSSSFAAAGTLCHEIGETLGKFKTNQITLKQHKADLNRIRAHELYTPALEEYACTYVEFCLSQGEHHEWEVRVDMSDYIPGNGFGTTDHRAYVAQTQTLRITDLKGGAGVAVSAHNNGQLMGYALGSLEQLMFTHDIVNVQMSIVQPALDSISTFEMTAKELLNWGAEVLRPAALKAWNGEGEFVPSEKGCRFCKLRYSCRARASASATEDFTPTAQMTDEEIEAALAKADQAISFYKDIQTYALERALAGKQWAAYKLVEGRSVRKITDEDSAGELLAQAGFPEEVTHVKTLIKLGQLEKLVGKKALPEILGGLLVKAPGKPTLVPAADERGSYNPAAADFE